jgi:hypothetical protein
MATGAIRLRSGGPTSASKFIDAGSVSATRTAGGGEADEL